MFLSELYQYKKRMDADPDSGMSPAGFSEENISFVLRITPNGKLKDCLSLITDKKTPLRMKVPAAESRGPNYRPNFLWDNTGYVLGVDSKGKPERTAKTFEAFRTRHRQTADTTKNPHIQALAAFLDQWNPENFEDLPDHETMLDKNLVFQIVGEKDFLHNMPEVRTIWENTRHATPDASSNICLITGHEGPIARVHPVIKGVHGAQSTGAALISFNCSSFESYGKSQSNNAPVSTEAAEAYTTALNYLLRSENRHSVTIGDTAVLFWAEKAAPQEEKTLFELLNIPNTAEDTSEDDLAHAPGEDGQTVNRVRDVLAALRQGIPQGGLPGIDPDVRFFLLGLAPNQARLVVRFWLTTTFGELTHNVGRFYADLRIAHADTQPEFPAFWQLLREVALLGKAPNIPPFVGGALARSAFSGTRYPEALYTAVLSRIHADKQISYLRAALLKAILIRNHNKEIAMSLDTSRTDTSYLLGRLFSLLQKNQTDALGNINATIRDRYIGSASATPRRVFPLLLRLTQHHASKSEYGDLTQKNIAAVIENITDFPTSMTLEEQGTFFLGYYQQNNANYRKKAQEQE